jgi:hypothetical protein
MAAIQTKPAALFFLPSPGKPSDFCQYIEFPSNLNRQWPDIFHSRFNFSFTFAANN